MITLEFTDKVPLLSSTTIKRDAVEELTSECSCLLAANGYNHKFETVVLHPSGLPLVLQQDGSTIAKIYKGEFIIDAGMEIDDKVSS